MLFRMAHKLCNVHELARRLRLPVPWLSRAANSKVIPCLRVGGRRLFEFNAVEDALARLAAGGGSGLASTSGSNGEEGAGHD